MKNKTFTTQGIVLKRVNTGETDRIINILTKEYGKLTCVAKGVRKIKSSKRAFLEPGNIINAFLIKTKSLPLLTQATLVTDCSSMKPTLASFRQLSQMLEIFERLFVEQKLENDIFELIMQLRSKVITNTATNHFIKQTFTKIITNLGFQDPEESKYDNISDYISALSDRKIKSFEYLYIK